MGDTEVDPSKVRGCVAFSLYGDAMKYAGGAVENVGLVAKYFPGWECRIYLEKGHYARRALLTAGANVIDMGSSNGSGGMFWRFLACDDNIFTHVIVRDADSRINPRDQACVKEWVASGKSLHVIKDNPHHHSVAVLGGAWGMVTGKLNLAQEIGKWTKRTNYGDDEEFLHWRVWEHFRPLKDYLRHDYACGQDNQPIPDHEDYKGYICERMSYEFSMPGKWAAVMLSPARSSKRRRDFYDRLRAYGGFLVNKVRWWRGIEAAETDIPSDFMHAAKHPHYYLNTMDHHAVLRWALEEDLDYLFVFEDDALIRDDFDEYLARALMCVPEDWLALQLGGQAWSDNNRQYYEIRGERAFPDALARVCGCLGQHGVLWNRQGIEEAVGYFTVIRPKWVIDQAFAAWQKETCRFYTPARWLVEINSNTAQHGQGV